MLNELACFLNFWHCQGKENFLPFSSSEDKFMTIERYLHCYLFTALVGINLLQSAFTNWCPMMPFLRKVGAGRGGR